jgi:hypothetical protein
VETAVKHWLKEQDTDFYEQGTEKLIAQDDKCLALLKVYTEE